MKHPRLRLGLGLALLLILGPGCASAPPPRPSEPPRPAEAPAPASSQKAEDDRDGLSLSGGFGRLDEADAEQAFRGHLDEINRCYQDALKTKWFLGGRLELKLRVAPDGKVAMAAVAQSSLGSFEVERCVQKVVAAIDFPRPKGGEAELTYPVEFPQRAPVRSWPEERVASSMARHRGEVSGCRGKAPPRAAQRASASKEGSSSALRVTVYVGPGGRVASAGLAADEPIDEKVGACLVGRALTWRFEDPLGQLTKASFAFD